MQNVQISASDKIISGGGGVSDMPSTPTNIASTANMDNNEGQLINIMSHTIKTIKKFQCDSRELGIRVREPPARSNLAEFLD